MTSRKKALLATGTVIKGLKLSGFTNVGLGVNNVDNATLQNVLGATSHVVG